MLGEIDGASVLQLIQAVCLYVAAALALQQAGLIDYKRARITVIDAGLAAAVGDRAERCDHVLDRLAYRVVVGRLGDGLLDLVGALLADAGPPGGGVDTRTRAPRNLG